MKSFDNALQIFKLTPQTNCRECFLPTCMAFAGAVFTGTKRLSDCPYIPEEILEEYCEKPSGHDSMAENVKDTLAKLRNEIAKIDLSTIADKLGGTYKDNWLTLSVLGKKYSVADDGRISTDIHVNPWVAIPVYDYLLHGGRGEIKGRWVPLRELPSGKDWYRLFGQRCEAPLKKLADASPELFADMIRLFDAKQVESHDDADVSVVLYPLPKLPILICYWYADEGMESDLHLFFDESAEDFVDPNSINSIGSGFVTMLEKLSLRHS